MSGIFKRFSRIARAYVLHEAKRFTDRPEPFLYDDAPGGGPDSSPKAATRSVPEQVREDLAIFNLAPPGSLAAVRRARNREIKKYHSDRFADDPEKFQTSKEIMQIYNAAFQRLELYYKQQGPAG